MTQEMLAEQLGVTRQAVARWETGKALPGTANLFMLRQLLGIPLEAADMEATDLEGTKGTEKITPNPLRLRFWVTYQSGESEPMLDVLTFCGNKDYQVFFRIGKDQSDCIFTTNESEALAGEVRSLLESRANDK